jgi:hypothetical protein
MFLAMILMAQAAAPAAQSAPEKPKPRLVCRTYEETGSLVKKQRICRTVGGWTKAEADARTEADRLNQHVSAQRGN